MPTATAFKADQHTHGYLATLGAFTPWRTLCGGEMTTNYANSPGPTGCSPDMFSYLRFEVQGLTQPVTRATLRIYANSGSSVGYEVGSVGDNSWGEATITYDNAPLIGSAIGSMGAFGGGTWTSIDVTSYVTGNGCSAWGGDGSSAINLEAARPSDRAAVDRRGRTMT
jgi:hypothetical protein